MKMEMLTMINLKIESTQTSKWNIILLLQICCWVKILPRMFYRNIQGSCHFFREKKKRILLMVLPSPLSTGCALSSLKSSIKAGSNLDSLSAYQK